MAKRKPYSWTTGCRPSLEGLAAYVIMRRGPRDPPRPPRKDPRRIPWRTCKNWTDEEVRERMLALLTDHVPRTYNGICVHIGTTTADAAPDSFEEALWTLVEERIVWFTIEAPVMFCIPKPGVRFKFGWGLP